MSKHRKMIVDLSELKKQFSPDEKLGEATRYTWVTLPNNWLVVQERCVVDNGSAYWPKLSFSKPNTKEKEICCPRMPRIGLREFYFVFKEDCFCLLGDKPKYHLMSTDYSLENAFLWSQEAWKEKLDGDLSKELTKISEKDFRAKVEKTGMRVL